MERVILVLAMLAGLHLILSFLRSVAEGMKAFSTESQNGWQHPIWSRRKQLTGGSTTFLRTCVGMESKLIPEKMVMLPLK